MAVKQIILDYIEDHDLDLPFDGVRATCREIAAECDHSASTISRTYYRMLDQKDQGRSGDRDRAPEPDEEPPDSPLGVSSLERDYFYNELNDLYLVWLPHRPKTLQVEGEIVREMKRAYSEMPGGYDTINEICQRFGWRRKDFQAFKRIMGWTHDQDPYTDEEHASTPTPDLVQDYAARKRGEFERQLRKQEWQQAVDDAQKWRKFQRQRLDPLADYVSDHPPRPREEIDTIGRISPNPYLAVFSPADAHLHKQWKDGQGFERVRSDLLATTDDLCERVLLRGRPDQVAVVLGNDWWHVDTPAGTTTAGTPQDTDGLPGPDMVAQGYEVAAEIIDRLRQLADSVRVVIVPSNHGEWSDYHLHAGLRFGYRDHDDVEITGTADHRQYIEYGENLIGLEHGDGPKEDDLPMIMATEQRKAWGDTSRHYWLTAHRHQIKETDCGAIVMQAPSLAGHDRWHDKQGYVISQRANVCYLFDRDRGHTDRLLAIVD